MKTLDCDSTISNVDKVISFINDELDRVNCPQKTKVQIDVAIDELFSNIANYAYNPDVGDVTVTMETHENTRSVVITFIDKGKPYDPLKKDDPNVNASLNEREIGGLGIYIVKKSMDDVQYEYKDGKNILTIKKNI